MNRRALVRTLACVLAVSGATPIAGAQAAAGMTTAGVTTGSVTVVGSGFGHGVGMSQYGALGMARAGFTATQILSHYYTGVTVAPTTDKVDLRVNVVHGSRSVTLRSTALDTGGGGFVLTLVSASTSPVAPVSLGVGDVVVVTPSSGRLAVAVRRASGPRFTLVVRSVGVRWRGTRALAGIGTTLGVSSLPAGTSTKVKSRAYRWGAATLTPVGSLVDAVVAVDLHSEYLRGIAEVPSSWPAAALQTQVVAARNYALSATRAAPRSSCGGCQIWDDTRSQVYSGWAKESEQIGSTSYGARWVAAVNATQSSSTRGLAVLYRGTPIVAYYASSTGGRTRYASEVWGTAVPYLRSVADPWSVDPQVNPGYARWTRGTTVERLRALFALPDLATVRVTMRDAAGAAKVVTATSSTGTRTTLSGNVLSSRLGLPAAWITTLTLPKA